MPEECIFVSFIHVQNERLKKKILMENVLLNFLCIEMIVKLLKFIFGNLTLTNNKFMVLPFIKTLKILK